MRESGDSYGLQELAMLMFTFVQEMMQGGETPAAGIPHPSFVPYPRS